MACNREGSCGCEITIQSEFSNKKPKSILETFKTIFSLRILQLLRNNGHNKSFSTQEDNNKTSTTLNHYNHWRESQAALLEAERNKAAGLMEWQRRRVI